MGRLLSRGTEFLSTLFVKRIAHLIPFVFVSILVLGVWPVFDFPDAGKHVAAALASGVLAVGVGLYILANRKERDDASIRSLAAVMGIAMVCVILLALRGGITLNEMYGFAFDVGSIMSFAILGVVFFCSYLYVRCGAPMHRLALFALGTIVLGSLLYVAGMLLSIPLFMSVFGGWVNTQLFFGIGFLIALYAMTDPGMSRRITWVRIAGASAAVWFLCAGMLSGDAGFTAAAGIFGFLLLIFGRSFSKFNQWSIAAALLCGIAVLAGVLILPRVDLAHASNPFYGDMQELRPSMEATVHTALAAYGDNPMHALTGVGPNLFSAAWAKYRPAIINQSPLWDTDFASGYGVIPTVAVTHGVPFTLVLLLFAGLGIVNLFLKRATDRFVGVSLHLYVTLTCFALWWIFFHVPNLAFIAFGAWCAGAVYAMGSAANTSVTTLRIPNRFARFVPAKTKLLIPLIIPAVMVGSGVLFLFSGTARGYALGNFEMGLQTYRANSQNDMRAASYIERSIQLGDTAQARRAVITIYVETLRRTLAKDPAALSDSERTKIRDVQNLLGVVSNDLPKKFPESYRSWMALGTAQSILGLLSGDVGSVENAIGNYRVAQVLAPNHPVPLFLEAQAQYFLGNNEESELALEKALNLKPDYQEALDLQQIIAGSTQE